MRYSITDLAEILGCTTSAIHYFEKENLLKVEKEENGHRFYNVVDVFRLLSYTKYRAMEIPMKTIIKQFGGKENNYQLIEEREMRSKQEALKKVQYYTNLAEAIEEHLVSIRRMKDLLNRYELAQSPEMLVMCDEECGWLSKNRNSQQFVHKWVRCMPTVQLAVLNKDMGLSDFGYIVSPQKQKELELPLVLHNRILEQTSCLHTIVVAEEDFVDYPQKVFVKMREDAKKLGLTLGDMLWGKILLVEVEEGEKLHTYVELWGMIKL